MICVAHLNISITRAHTRITHMQVRARLVLRRFPAAAICFYQPVQIHCRGVRGGSDEFTAGGTGHYVVVAAGKRDASFTIRHRACTAAPLSSGARPNLSTCSYSSAAQRHGARLLIFPRAHDDGAAHRSAVRCLTTPVPASAHQRILSQVSSVGRQQRLTLCFCAGAPRVCPAASAASR